MKYCMLYALCNIPYNLQHNITKIRKDTYSCSTLSILLTKTTAAQNEDALSYHSVRGLYFLAVVFVATIEIATINAR